MQFVLSHPRLNEFRSCTLKFLKRHHVDLPTVHVIVPQDMADSFKMTGVNVHVICNPPVEGGPFHGGVHMGKLRTQVCQMFDIGTEIIELDDNITEILVQRQPVQNFIDLMKSCFELLKGKVQIFGLNPGHMISKTYSGSPDVLGLHQVPNGCVGFHNMGLTLTLPMREDIDRVMVIFSQGGQVLRRRGHQVVTRDMSCWHSHLGHKPNSEKELAKHIEDELLSTHRGVYLQYQGGWGGFGIRMSGKMPNKRKSTRKSQTRASSHGKKRSHHKKKTGAELAL